MRTIIVCLTLVVSLTACGISPDPITGEALLGQARADAERTREGVDPLSQDLTLEEAIARALKFNLDRRVKMMEEALSLNQLDVTRLDMLPKLVGQTGFSERNNDRITFSQTTIGQPSSDRFISSDRSHKTQELGISWSLLDLGLGVFNSQQQADRVLVASERRRKAMHVLMQDVRTAFCRALSAQQLRPLVERVTKEAEAALEDARKAENQRIRTPIDSLRYQRQVLENLRLLESIDHELSAAQTELASLINLPIGSTITLAEPALKPDVAALEIPLEDLEEMALSENADLREQAYNYRMASVETRKTLVRLFPNLGVSFARKYDSDSYQVNRHWEESSLQISYNLVNLLTLPIQTKLADAGVKLAEQRRMAVQMAVVAQVHVARQQFANALSQSNRAQEIWQTDDRIAEFMSNREAAGTQGKLDLVSNQTAAVLSLLRRYQAAVAVFTAEARLSATLGVEPRIGSVQDQELAGLTRIVSRSDSITKGYKMKRALADAKASAQSSAEAVEVARKALAEAEQQLSAAVKAAEKAGDASSKAATVLERADARLRAAMERRAVTEGRANARIAELKEAAAVAQARREEREKAVQQLASAEQELAAAFFKAEEDVKTAVAARDAARAQAVDEVEAARRALAAADSSRDEQKRQVRQLSRAQSEAQDALEASGRRGQSLARDQARAAERATAEVTAARQKKAAAEAELNARIAAVDSAAKADVEARQKAMEGQEEQAANTTEAGPSGFFARLFGSPRSPEQALADARAEAAAARERLLQLDQAVAAAEARLAQVAESGQAEGAQQEQAVRERTRDAEAASAALANARAALQTADQALVDAGKALDAARENGRAATKAAQLAVETTENNVAEVRRQWRGNARQLERAKRENAAAEEELARAQHNEARANQELASAVAEAQANAQPLEAARQESAFFAEVMAKALEEANVGATAASADVAAKRAALEAAIATAKQAADKLLQLREAAEGRAEI